jgi:hypothetical protein
MIMAFTNSVASFAQIGEKPRNADDDIIIVTGPEEFQKQVSRFIERIIPIPRGGRYQGQYARFNSPICPVVHGLSDSNEKLVIQRMHNVLRSASLKSGKDGCDSNLHLVVVENGANLVSALRHRNHKLFGELQLYERDRIEQGRGPVFSWQQIQTVPVSGGQTTRTNENLSSGTAGTANFSGTLITLPVQKDMQNSFLFLEKSAIVGLTTVQIADYAILRSLIEVKQDKGRDENTPSILSLFDKDLRADERPNAASLWDIALLNALYSSPANVNSFRQKSLMIHRIQQNIADSKTAFGEAAE